MRPLSTPTDPPLSPAVLERLVLRWRRDAPTSGLGAHQRRRQGHSLDFREYHPWQRGDDIRKVDWRASARQPRRGELLLRSFEAEERLALAIMIDNRQSMALPEAMPRLLWALWAARALAMLALDKGDEVTLARLFSGAAEPVLELRGPEARVKLRTWTEALWSQRGSAGESLVDLDRIAAKMRPAGATVLISDMLFDDAEGRVQRFARQMQRHKQSFSVVQLDSTAQEIGLLRAARTFHLLRPGEAASDETQLFDETVMQQATNDIASYLRKMRKALQGGGLDWPNQSVVWPHVETPGGVGSVTTRQTGTVPGQDAGLEQLKTLFAQTFPKLPLLAGLALGGGRV